MDARRVAAIPFFDGISEQEVDVVARMATEVEFSAGQAITTEGDFGHGLFVIETGSAEVSTDGKQVAPVGPGAVVGEVAVLAAGRRSASVVATSPLKAIALFKRDVWALEREAPEAARRLREALEQHVGVASAPLPGDA